MGINPPHVSRTPHTHTRAYDDKEWSNPERKDELRPGLGVRHSAFRQPRRHSECRPRRPLVTPGPLHPTTQHHAASCLPSTCLERTDGTTYNNNNNDKHEESAHVLQQERPSLALMCVCLLKSSCMSIQHSTTNHMEGEHATSQQDRPSLSLMRAVSRPYHHAIHVMQFKEHTSSASNPRGVGGWVR